MLLYTAWLQDVYGSLFFTASNATAQLAAMGAGECHWNSSYRCWRVVSLRLSPQPRSPGVVRLTTKVASSRGSKVHSVPTPLELPLPETSRDYDSALPQLSRGRKSLSSYTKAIFIVRYGVLLFQVLLGLLGGSSHHLMIHSHRVPTIVTMVDCVARTQRSSAASSSLSSGSTPLSTSY
jgi:hypothetical protein